MEFSRPEHWSGLPFPSLGDLPNPGFESRSPVLQVDSLLCEPPGEPNESVSCSVMSDSLQSHELPGSSVHGILQARVLELAAIPFSRGSSHPETEPGSPALQADSLPSESPGKP